MLDHRGVALLPYQQQARIAGERIKAAGAGRAMQAGTDDIFPDPFSRKVENACADRAFRSVLRIRDRDDDMVLVGNRDAVMRRGDADGARLGLAVEYRL